MAMLKVSDVIGLSQPVTKLIEVISNAFGTAYKPIDTILMAKAKSKEIEIISSAIKKNINLPLKYDDGKLLIDAASAEELIKRTGNRLVFQEINKQQNIDSVINNAYENLKEEKTVSEEPVDKDWILRFFNSVEDISNEKMQKIWGKILAGEIKKPNTFSFRTLEVLKNLTQEEAQLFTEISEFVMETKDLCFIPSNGNLLEKYGISYEKILNLEESGLINARSIGLTNNILPDEQTCINNNKLVCLFKVTSKVKQDIDISVYQFTKAGIQLLKIIDKKSNDTYAKDFFKQIKVNNKSYLVTVHKINQITNDNDIECEDEDLLIDVK